jgi:hypothetical protein
MHDRYAIVLREPPAAPLYTKPARNALPFLDTVSSNRATHRPCRASQRSSTGGEAISLAAET